MPHRIYDPAAPVLHNLSVEDTMLFGAFGNPLQENHRTGPQDFEIQPHHPPTLDNRATLENQLLADYWIFSRH